MIFVNKGLFTDSKRFQKSRPADKNATGETAGWKTGGMLGDIM